VDPARWRAQARDAFLRREVVQQALGLRMGTLDLARQLLGRVQPRSRAREHRVEQIARRSQALRCARKFLDHELLEALESVLALLEHDAAAQDVRRRREAQHEAIAGRYDDGFFESELRQRFAARLEHFRVEEHELAQHFGRPRMKTDLRAVLDGAIEIGECLHRRAEHRRCAKVARRRGDHSARHDVVIDVGHVDRGGMAGAHDVDGLRVGLHPAHFRGEADGQDLEHVAVLHRARHRDAGDHGAVTVRAEHTLDRQSKNTVRAARFRLGRHAKECCLECVEANACEARQRQDRRILEERAAHGRAHVVGGELDERGFDRIDLRERHEAAR